jgi:alpha-glucosidase
VDRRPERDWWRGVVYQIYPRSFADSDGDGIGDLPGVLAHLDHLNDGTEGSLGVDAIWLSPFYPSPMADFGYDVADYTGVDPRFGTLEDVDRLIAEAHRRGVRVMIDWVPNHSSDRHPWFAESRASRESAKRDWYVWRDGTAGGGPPNNWRSDFARAGGAWTRDGATGQWYLHSFLPEQPDLNWENPEVREAMHDTLRFWLDRGVDGFRIDVAHKLGKDPALREDAPGERPRGGDWPTGHERLRGIRRVLEEYEGRAAVGEVYLLDQARLAEYVNSGDELHLAHNFVFLRQPWDAAAIGGVVDEFERLTAADVWPAWCLANHDHSRVATRYDAGTGRGPAIARAAAVLLLTLRGTPFLFQGEELGLPDAPIPPERVVDVDGRDPERAPIPWRPPSAAGPGAGFTTGEPWLPIVPEAERLNAESQSADPDSTLALYRRLIWLRRRSPALRAGGQRAVALGEGVFGYVRQLDEERLLIAINFTPRPVRLESAAAGLAGSGRILVSSDPERAEGPVDPGDLRLGPDEAVVVRLP